MLLENQLTGNANWWQVKSEPWAARRVVGSLRMVGEERRGSRNIQ